MLGDLMVTTFLVLLAASIVVVCLMVMFPLIDLAFRTKPAPRPAQVETWQHGGLTHAQLSGRPWLALRSDFLRPDAVPHSPLPLVGMAYHALAHPPLERYTFKVRSLVERFQARRGPGIREEGPTPRGDHEDRRRGAAAIGEAVRQSRALLFRLRSARQGLRLSASITRRRTSS